MKPKTIGKRRIAAKAKKVTGKRKAVHMNETGLTTRIYAHLSSRVRRDQSRRDAQRSAAESKKK